MNNMGLSRSIPHLCRAGSIGMLFFSVAATQAQVFGPVGVDINWATNQTAWTIAVPSGQTVCQTPWNAQWEHVGPPFTIDDSLNDLSGGCALVVLGRAANASATCVPASSATLNLLLRIEAASLTEPDRYGTATGTMTGTGTAWVSVQQWIRADILIRFIADASRDNATTFLEARFAGPIDPLTANAILIDHRWEGSTRSVTELDNTLLAPGRYELNFEPTGQFLPILVNRYAAQASAYTLIDHPVSTNAPAAWDLDGDGTVGLADACLWSDNPSDVTGDDSIDQADLEFLLALARANGEIATDNNLDGVPDQCDSGCAADFNNDDAVDFFDLQSFLSAFVAQLPEADLNQDNAFDFFDVLAFLNIFSTGC